ncbi:ABC transporter ATP-binding protein [Oricola sp.]|uniref:ABC transporter ATP-binding protein n=1 Tax=Oricola sp. TaxID=1979950 RepID=UPI0025D81847|nr:ABC transporter ATP-binding protein [Oricola sp.]MCI5075396.1 ABC transporter ATP-binding protein [Oricola sp.]
MSLLKISGLTVRYGTTLALDDVSIQAPEGEVTCVLGANGAGKSTMFRTIMGLVGKESGSIRFGGAEIANTPTQSIVRQGIILCPEGRRLFPEMSVAENVRMGAYLVRDSEIVRQRLDTVHRLFPRISEREHQQASSLSGGEQQMVAIARAMMGNPRLLLLDEPTLGLAPRLIHEVLQTVRRIRDEGTTVILVEQNAAQALKVSDRAYVLETGRMAMSGSSADIMADPRVREIYLGG